MYALSGEGVLDKREFGGNKMERPITILFMLMSVDGKISTGAADSLDADKDFPQLRGLRRVYINIMK